MATTFDMLSASRAECLDHLPLGHGRALAIWRNTRDRISYDAPSGHTLSLYLKGGTGSRRLDRGGVAGYPGAFCLMPEGEFSDWEIDGEMTFVHLYLPDAELRHFIARTFDRSPGRLSLRGRTFDRNSRLVGPMNALLRAQSPLARDEALTCVMAGLTRHCAPGTVSGGLTPAVSRRVCAALADRLDAPPSLSELAQIAGLSPWHLQRMFRARHGVSPHGWLERARIDRAKALIAKGIPLARVAAGSGYANQSHLTRAFLRATGVTPGRYRAALRG